MAEFIQNVKDMETGKSNLDILINSCRKADWQWTEQDTRFQFIDDFLVYCLGWDKEFIETERYQNGDYTDYELGKPRCCVVEAKKESIKFEFPSNGREKYICSIESIMASNQNAKDAINQVSRYCFDRGVELAVIINSCQIIAFLASRRDGISPLKGDAFIIRNEDELSENFHLIWQFISCFGVRDRNLYDFFIAANRKYLPSKLSNLITDYKAIRYKNDNQKSLENLSELLIQDLVTTSDVEEEFFQECYCQSGALSQDALISKEILAKRYASLFPQNNIIVENLVSKGKKNKFSENIYTEALSKRPIVIIGDVGVGKTSFLKSLKYLDAKEEFENSIYLYIDLGFSGTLTDNLKAFVMQEIEEQLLNNYEIDIYASNFIQGVYHSEIQRFQNGIYKELMETDEKVYHTKLLEHIESFTSDKQLHLNRSINHIAKARKKQVIITIDNADQRTTDIQDEAFVIAQEFASRWKAMTFIALMPDTFYQSKMRGRALSGYSQKVFTIFPPRIEQVIEKRLQFSLKVAQGKTRIKYLNNVSLDLSNIVLFIKALLYSINNNKDIREMLSNITGGNVRLIIDFIAKFISNANVNSDKIISYSSEGDYLIPLHEFSKAAILGEYSYFNEDTSLAMNLFEISSPDIKEHFLSSMIVAYLNSKYATKDNDSFVSYINIVREMQNYGFTVSQVDFALRRLTNKKLIESVGRVEFERKTGILCGEIPDGFRITSIGSYHLNKWISEFSYLDAVCIDTPILDTITRDAISELKTSFKIEDRYNRVVLFRDYLSDIWNKINVNSNYFNWNDSVKIGTVGFGKVECAINKGIDENGKIKNTTED